MTPPPPSANDGLDGFRQQLDLAREHAESVRGMMRKNPSFQRLGVDMDSFDIDEEIKLIHGIIDSMTPAERHNHRLIDDSRCQRIALGAGAKRADILAFVKQYEIFKSFKQKVQGY